MPYTKDTSSTYSSGNFGGGLSTEALATTLLFLSVASGPITTAKYGRASLESQPVASVIRDASDVVTHAPSKRLPPSQERMKEVQVALARAGKRASRPNWDGDGSPPIGKATVRRARKILTIIVESVPAPDMIIADNDGSLSLDWNPARDWTVSVSVPGTGRIGFAALRHGQREFGVFDSSDDPPPGLVPLIESIIARRG